MEKGGIRLVVSRPGARRAPAASGSTEACWVGGGLEKLGEGRDLPSHSGARRAPAASGTTKASWVGGGLEKLGEGRSLQSRP